MEDMTGKTSADVDSCMPSSSSMASEIFLMKMIESRSLEVNALNNECKTKAPKLSAQRLPRFMRRRASSHDPRRIPKSVRQSMVKKFNESEKQPKVKKKSKKKYLNKIKRELSVKRRNDKKDRTVLHVWFAKRFKMQMMWNLLIPLKNNTKNQRLLYHNSKNDCVFYYMPFYQCIEIDYKLSKRENLISYLSHFTHSEIGFGFGAKVFESGIREGNVILYNYDSYPLDAITSCSFLWNNCLSKLWLWVHISVYDKVHKLLNEFMPKSDSNNFKLIQRHRQLERFRLIGPKVNQFMSYHLKFNFSEHFESNVNCFQTVYYFKMNENEALPISLNKSDLFHDKPETSCSQKPIGTQFLVIIKNKIFNNRFSTDLIVLSESAKHLWHKISQNRAHKVGGIGDFEMIALNTSSLLSHKMGFIDTDSDSEKFKTIKEIFKTDKKLYVIRNSEIISKLTEKHINSFTIENIFDKIDNENIGLINVEIECVDRGVPEELDLICIPTDNQINHFCNHINPENKIIANLNNESKTNTDHEHNNIGIIEFGKYSMELSRGKAIGVVSLTGLKQLIELREKCLLNNIYKNKILAAIRSVKSRNQRIVTLKVIDCVFSV